MVYSQLDISQQSVRLDLSSLKLGDTKSQRDSRACSPSTNNSSFQTHSRSHSNESHKGVFSINKRSYNPHKIR